MLTGGTDLSLWSPNFLRNAQMASMIEELIGEP